MSAPEPGRPGGPLGTPDVLPPVDLLASTAAGRYQDPLVTVTAGRDGRVGPGEPTVRTRHFDLTPVDRHVTVAHAVAEDEVDDGLADLLRDELFGPGWLRGPDLFERVLAGVVLTTRPDALDSWEVFYRNTLDRSSGRAAVDAHALDLLPSGSVLDLGCSFGFLALRAARTGRTTTGCDVAAGTVRLLSLMAPRLGVRLRAVTADAARYPGEDGSVDTVLAVHLLEHLEAAHGAQVLAEAVRLARRRVVVAVPLGGEPDESHGHVRTVTVDDLARWGRTSGHPFDVHERHGGWLVIDTS
jgi:SAM-dependent methyltransferase